MKKTLFTVFLLAAFIGLIPTSSAQEPRRTVKCCQVTTATSTLCRERNSACVKSATSPEGDYQPFDKTSKCSSNNTLRTEFHEGKCSGATVSSNSFTDLSLVGEKAGFSDAQKSPTAIATYIGKIINVALSLTGLIFLIYAVYSGIEWMTAGGNASRVSDARSRLIQAAIGMMITAIAYSAAALIIKIIGSGS